MGVKHKIRIAEGDKVGFWFKPDGKTRNELYLEDDSESGGYKGYSLRELPTDEAYAINVRGLSANGETILKPQLYNYARKGMYYPVLFAGFIAILMLLAFIISIFVSPEEYVINKRRDHV